MKIENENTQNKARRFEVVVTDLQKDEILMDVTTGAAIVTAVSPFDNIENKDKEGYAQGAHYFECKTGDIMNCIQSTVEGISKLAAENKELGFMLSLYMLSKQAAHSKDEEEENEKDE